MNFHKTKKKSKIDFSILSRFIDEVPIIGKKLENLLFFREPYDPLFYKRKTVQYFVTTRFEASEITYIYVKPKEDIY